MAGESAMLCISLKIRPVDICWRTVVHPHSRHPLTSWRLISSVRHASAAAVPRDLKARVRYELANLFHSISFTLKMKVKNVDDLDENEQLERRLSTFRMGQCQM